MPIGCSADGRRRAGCRCRRRPPAVAPEDRGEDRGQHDERQSVTAAMPSGVRRIRPSARISCPPRSCGGRARRGPVDDRVDDEDARAVDEDGRLHERVVLRLDRADDGRAEARPGEDVLDEDGAGDQRAEEQARRGSASRSRAFGQRVAEVDPPAREALRRGRSGCSRCRARVSISTRTIRASTAAGPSASATTGRMYDSGPSRRRPAASCSCTAEDVDERDAEQEVGDRRARTRAARERRARGRGGGRGGSRRRRRRRAGCATTTAARNARNARDAVAGRRWTMMSAPGTPADERRAEVAGEQALQVVQVLLPEREVEAEVLTPLRDQAGGAVGPSAARTGSPGHEVDHQERRGDEDPERHQQPPCPTDGESDPAVLAEGPDPLRREGDCLGHLLR